MCASQTAVAQNESAEEEQSDEETQLSKDVTFEILKNQRRRYVLEYLESSSGPVRLGELAEHVAAWENDTEVSKLSSKQRKRVYVGLYQGHLPKMDDAGVVEFNQDRGIVELTKRAEQLREYMDRETDDGSNWSLYYLGISIPGAGVLTAAWAGFQPFGAVPGIVWAWLVVGSLLLVALVHAREERLLSLLNDQLPMDVFPDRPEQT